MNTYINSILVIAVIGGVINALLPSENKNLKKYVNYSVSLILLIVLLTPISGLVSSVSKTNQIITEFSNNIINNPNIDKTNKIIVQNGVANVSKRIKEMVVNKFTFEDNDVFVYVHTNDSDINSIKIDNIIILLSGKAAWYDSEKVGNYVESIVGIPVSVKKN